MSYGFISEKNCISKRKQLCDPINLSLMHISLPCWSRKSIQPINVLENGKKKKRWCFCMVALPVTYKCLLNVSGNISMSMWVCERMSPGSKGWREEEEWGCSGGSCWGCTRWSCYFKASFFYCCYGIRGAEKKENKAKLLISDTTCFLRLLMKVYCKKNQ